MAYSKLNIGDLVEVIDASKYAITTELGIYTIIEEQIGQTYTTYLAVLMFGEEQNRIWIFPSQENKAWIKVSSVN
jgi:hypothetical protein